MSVLGRNRSKVLPFPKKGIALNEKLSSNLDINASSDQRIPALPEHELRLAVSRAVLHGTFRETFHSAEERSYRHITQEDILHMLQHEWALVGAEFDDEHHNWKYRVAGKDIEGDDLNLIIAIDPDENRITVISKF